MSRLGKLLAGWTFRTATPSFEPGDVITAFVTHSDGEGVSSRIGDSVLRIEGDTEVDIETKVRLKVTSFDEQNHVGTAEIVEFLGEF
ncbi:DUF7513 family protein [Haloferax larsenii]|uniref:DUF7513 domain-containing protein n=1 Tax=Haloferax larsenii TaxID=302484 RepID=A0A1H7J0S9_HALLR|nr:hypothetical protein [Haloferax larsenii]SEK68034.1 hypothetical protein SAMN04488691_1011070 [Haloferax larsenii]